MSEVTEEEIRATTAENLRLSSSSIHRMIDLYTLAEDCPHRNPDDDEKYEGVEDLVTEWMERNCAGLSTNDIYKWRRAGIEVSYEFVYKNRKRAHANIPLYNEWDRASEAYHAVHGFVCMESYMGKVCEECSEGDDDWGYDPAPCFRQWRAKLRQDEFFDLFTEENFDYQAKVRAA